jgi:hypothetical protein
MATIVTRSVKGSALTFLEADNNFLNLNTDKLEYTDITIAAEATAANNGGLIWNNTNGELTYIPPTPAGIGAATTAQGSLADSAMQDLIDDVTPQLGANLDVLGRSITTSTTNGDLDLGANGTGRVKISTGYGIDIVSGNITNTNTDGDVQIITNGDGVIDLAAATQISDLLAFAETLEALVSVSGTLSIDPGEGPIKYVVPSGAMTVNGFVSPVSGQTVTLLIDQATGGSNFTFTLGAGLLTPAGDGVTLTDSGYDLVTITCADATNGLYIVTSINDFQ